MVVIFIGDNCDANFQSCNDFKNDLNGSLTKSKNMIWICLLILTMVTIAIVITKIMISIVTMIMTIAKIMLNFIVMIIMMTHVYMKIYHQHNFSKKKRRVKIVMMRRRRKYIQIGFVEFDV